jgi:hopene-associated glycosyltransferase HpnB
MLLWLAAVPLLVWLYLLLLRGGFWRVTILRDRPHTIAKRIVAVIPARNEAAVIGEALASLMPQVAQIVLVDDGSTDGTAEIARAISSKVTVLEGSALPGSWTGKLWALAQGVEHAQTLAPDYLLFTDADIVHGASSVERLVAIAEGHQLDLASYMVKLECRTMAEQALIPAFVFFFLKLYPPKWIASPRARTAGAAGGCILVRPDALRRIGGIDSIRSEVIDDCALARAVKHSGGRIWMGLSAETRSIRSYGGFGDIGRMISRTAFNQLHHSTLLLALTISGLFITYLLPLLLLFTGRVVPAILGMAAWVLMSFVYLPMVRLYRQSPLWCLTLPGIAVFYAAATLHSALQYWRGRGGEWKGRVQDARVS